MSVGQELYRLYGLRVKPGFRLELPRAQGQADVCLVFRRGKRDSAGGDGPGWFSYRRWPDGSHGLVWRGFFECRIAPDGCRIEWRKLGRAAPEAWQSYLLSQALSFSLLARGREPLHASAVAVGGRVAAFLGDCGAGKSSLVASLVRAGCRLVTDDLLAITELDGVPHAEPGLPQLKLFPHVARRLWDAPARGARLNPGTRKLILPLAPQARVDRRLPLVGLYLLVRGERLELARLSPGAALLEIVRAAFNTLVTDPERLARQFAFARRLSAVVPVKRLAYPRRLSQLERVRDAVLADLESSGVTAVTSSTGLGTPVWSIAEP